MINMAFMPLYMWEMWDVTPVTDGHTDRGKVEQYSVWAESAMKYPIFNLKYTLLFNTFFFCLRCMYHKRGIVCKYCWKGPWISSSSLILGMFVRSQSKLQNNSEDQILFFNKRVIRKLKRDHFSWRQHRGWIVLSLRYFHYQSLTPWSW